MLSRVGLTAVGREEHASGHSTGPVPHAAILRRRTSPPRRSRLTLPRSLPPHRKIGKAFVHQRERAALCCPGPPAPHHGNGRRLPGRSRNCLLPRPSPPAVPRKTRARASGWPGCSTPWSFRAGPARQPRSFDASNHYRRCPAVATGDRGPDASRCRLLCPTSRNIILGPNAHPETGGPRDANHSNPSRHDTRRRRSFATGRHARPFGHRSPARSSRPICPNGAVAAARPRAGYLSETERRIFARPAPPLRPKSFVRGRPRSAPPKPGICPNGGRHADGPLSERRRRVCPSAAP